MPFGKIVVEMNGLCITGEQMNVKQKKDANFHPDVCRSLFVVLILFSTSRFVFEVARCPLVEMGRGVQMLSINRSNWGRASIHRRGQPTTPPRQRDWA